VLGIYFGLGFLVAFLPRVVWAHRIRSPAARTRRVQALVSRFMRGFFWIIQRLGRPTRVEIPDSIAALGGRVLVCNHISYLDPLLFVATFDQHNTVVKPVWFRVPLFGWILRSMGYFAPEGSRGSAPAVAERLDALREHLAGGGVLFLFPEGHRSRDGRLGEFQAGGFKLARLLGADLELLRIHGTGALFPPGAHAIRTGGGPRLRLEHLGRITAGELQQASSVREVVRDVKQRYQRAAESSAVESSALEPGAESPPAG
jgi:1-acyl-sn-glycerol-3-phosphate acyltransferase